MNEEEWRAQRARDMQERTSPQKGDEESSAKAEQQLDALLARILTPEARTRLTNVKLIDAEKYMQVGQALLRMLQQGRVQGKVTDEQIKNLLLQLTPKKDMTITRK